MPDTAPEPPVASLFHSHAMAFLAPAPLICSAPSSTLTSPWRTSRTPPPRPLHAPPLPRAAPRMIAAEPATATELSLHAIQLQSYVRGHKSIFRPGRGFNSTTITLFRKNDTGRSYTPLEELSTNAAMLPGGAVAAQMLMKHDELLRVALAAAVETAPEISRDDTLQDVFNHDVTFMLRVISYGAACQASDFIHENNMGLMKLLHAEVGIPHSAISNAILAVKKEILQTINEQHLILSTAECFDVVADFMAA